MTHGDESPTEVHMQKDTLANPKITRRIGTWNVRTMYATGKTAQVMKEMRRYRLDILGISECRWTGSGKINTNTGETIIYSGRSDNHHSNGVAIAMTKEASKSLDEWTPISDRIITARFWSKYIKTTIIQVYAPTNDADEDDKDCFYEQLQQVVDKTPRHDTMLIIGDLNAKIGDKLEGEDGIVGRHGIQCERSDNGEKFVEFCGLNNFAITTTMFPHKDIHLYTWTTPNGQHKNQIDHVAINGKFKRSINDVKVMRGADVGSDHNLLIIKLKLKLHKVQGKTITSKRYESCKLKIPEIKDKFTLELRNRFNALTVNEEQDIENQWSEFKNIYNETALDIIGPRKKSNQEWISADSWKLVDERKALKNKIDGTRSERVKERMRQQYSNKDKDVKKSMKKDKKQWFEKLATEAETAASKGNMKAVYDITKALCKDKPKQIEHIKDKSGTLLTKESEVKSRWQEHFYEVLNRPEPLEPAEIVTDGIEALPINVEHPTLNEVRSVIKELKNGKAPGIDNITSELLTADSETSSKQIHKLLKTVWNDEKIPTDWTKGLIVKLPKKGDLTNCGNWRGITLIPTTSKILGKIIVNRIAAEVNKHLREEQAGFREGRGTTEQIFILRNIIEQTVEWNSNLYICFIDFEKAFDSVHQETLWKIIKHYGIPEKLIRLLKCMYINNECAVITSNGTSDWFKIKSGVKQGCNMSGFLFLIVIDWIMRKSTAENNTGIRWNFTTKLDDLDYADDIALLSSTREQLQRKFNNVSRYAQSTGLKINAAKTKVMRLNANTNQPVISTEQKEIEDVKSFTYLGAILTNTGGTNEDIRRRLGLARITYNKLAPIWNNNQISKRTKFRLFNSNVLSVLLYGSETWKMTKKDEHMVDTFLHKSLRRILKIYWPQRVSNEEVRERAGIEIISVTIKRRRWKWLGHVLRMENTRHAKLAVTWTPEGKRKRGRPKETWRRTTERERKDLGFLTWTDATKVAADRDRWRGLVNGPILRKERRK